FTEREGMRVAFNRAARATYLAFAVSQRARWTGNFCDLAASVTRMATLSSSGRIDKLCVHSEIARLERLWSSTAGESDGLEAVLPFDRVQLAEVVRVCRTSRSLSEAGRSLFAASRQLRSSTNDADRL